MFSKSTDTGIATRWVVVLTAIGSVMAALDTLVVASALSKIRLDLGASIEQLALDPSNEEIMKCHIGNSS